MSINRDMKPVLLQIKESARTPSGASKETWADVRTIDVAIYKKNDMRVTASEKYNESSHTGLTQFKGLKEGKYRLVRGLEPSQTIYSISACNTESRLTNLLLKVVDADAG